MTSLEIKNINKHYGAVQALHDVSLSINKGEFVTLLGPSGSGKTTVLKILAGFEPVTSGQVLMEGRDVTALPPEKRNFGLVFQGYALFPHMSVYDNIAYPLRVRRQSKAMIDERVLAALDLVQLRKFANRRPQELSGGQQQRVALARALVFKPDVLLLDEPMSALDKQLRHDLQEELREIHRSLGTTFINVTHDQEEAMHMSDRIAIMDHGQIKQYDTAHQLYRRPASRFVAEFVGKSNVFQGEVRGSGSSARFYSASFEMPLADAQTGASTVMIRPEDAEITTTAPNDGRITLPVQVISSTYSGDRALYTLLQSDGADFIAYAPARSGVFPDGTDIFVSFASQDVIALA
ncbi:ABC transporter ATP-binding protein [Mycoplana dimorpha]|uniref:Spermidine/putrescine import ATP-binding protein PotA n=1 Tax=Mycoplana dimorpha TaxID=28320 RepID=A0A2T5AQZ9_MYCDI|nr:ABC transporter ATP-binding protein [Mycoplana dimorpha]PTM89153.1 putative spermidine/putrescine transport system ATP-binding protein [Mycoplana dimorpha]